MGRKKDAEKGRPIEDDDDAERETLKEVRAALFALVAKIDKLVGDSPDDVDDADDADGDDADDADDDAGLVIGWAELEVSGRPDGT